MIRGFHGFNSTEYSSTVEARDALMAAGGVFSSTANTVVASGTFDQETNRREVLTVAYDSDLIAAQEYLALLLAVGAGGGGG